MTANEVHATTAAPVVPRPRKASGQDAMPHEVAARFPHRVRPRSEYWDVETATWCSRGPVPLPPAG